MSEDSIEQGETVEDTQVVEYPSFKRFAITATAVYIAVFLVALDRSIVATAIPRITDRFHR